MGRGGSERRCASRGVARDGAGLAGLVAVVTLALGGCAGSAVVAPTSSSAAPSMVEVHCGEDLSLRVSSPTVTATSSGVAVRVTSEAAEGACLNYGLGGDELPATAEVWTLAAPPGDMQLSCSTLAEEGPELVVTVTDPDGHWSPLTLGELGCVVSGMPGWVVEGGSGATAREAIDALAASFAEAGVTPALTRSMRAAIGYTGGATQTWIVGTAETPTMTAVVMEKDGIYKAWPDALCAPGPWPADV